MYAPFFGLQQEAFSIAPDPRFLHLSTSHREALAHLLYGLQAGGGFVLLTGEIGTGKTTVCRCFLDQIPPGHQVAYIVNPRLTPLELLQTICEEFGVPLPGAPAASVKPWVDALNQHLLQAHAAADHCLLVIDEAQGLSVDLLEQLRLLTNLETHDRKLLQIVLIGQPELRTLLDRPELEQLSQRVIARVHLQPLSHAETVDYVQHRLAVAGHGGPMPFDGRALALVHRLSRGVPRRINLVCQRALLGAYAQGQRQIGPATVRQAAREVFGNPASSRAGGWPGWARPAMVAVGGMLLAGAAWWWVSALPTPATADAATGPPPAASSVAIAGGPMAYSDDRQAWTALAARWSLAPTPGEPVCGQVRRVGLVCHEGRGDLALLRQLRRPALLQLHAGGLVLLRDLDDEHAVLDGAPGRHRVPLAQLQAAWSGQFSTLWRPPPGWTEAGVRLSAESAGWVLEQLTALQGAARSGGGRAVTRDELLRQRVFAFQVQQGLDLDGLAGPITLMQLNRASGIDEPQLQPER